LDARAVGASAVGVSVGTAAEEGPNKRGVVDDAAAAGCGPTRSSEVTGGGVRVSGDDGRVEPERSVTLVVLKVAANFCAVVMPALWSAKFSTVGYELAVCGGDDVRENEEPLG
jgi:hypothetical protein